MSMNQLKINPTITIRVPSLDKYLQEISREPLLTTSEEVALAQKIRQGGRDADKAKEKLVRGNLRFVVSVAKPGVAPHRPHRGGEYGAHHRRQQV